MRKIVLSFAVAAAFGLAGCSGGGAGTGSSAAPGSADAPSASTAAQAATPATTTVTGTIGLRNPGSHQLSDQAKLTIKLVDASATGSAPLDVKVIDPVKQLPVDFSFTIDPATFHSADVYVVQAEIVDGKRNFTMPLQAPVLTRGAPAEATIRLVAQQTPGEKMLDAYRKLKTQAGAMKISKGTSLSKSQSRGWQVFRDAESGKVRYVVELTNIVKGDFIHTEFAYKDDKPWVVIQDRKSSQHAKASEIDRAGWDESGKLVLAEQDANGKTTTLDADTAAKLHKEAEAMLARAKKTR